MFFGKEKENWSIVFFTKTIFIEFPVWVIYLKITYKNVINKSIYQITVVFKITFKMNLQEFIEAYKIVERKLKLSNKTPLHRKSLRGHPQMHRVWDSGFF